MMKRPFCIVAVAVVIAACSSGTETRKGGPVVTSLLGKTFFEPERTPQQQSRLDSNLRIAKANFDSDPSEENYIWYGRRTAYLMRLEEAIDIYTEGLEEFPESYRLLRHRGHRYISLRKFDEAIADLSKAEKLMEGRPTEIEQDGIPNKLNIPLSTTQFNVFYHLALAHYLKGDFPKSEETWLKCLDVSQNDDSRIAVLDWLFMTLSRQGKTGAAGRMIGLVDNNMQIIENDSYFTRVKLYRGELTPDQVLQVNTSAADYDLSLATQGYGVGNWYYYNGDTASAFKIFRQVVAGKEFAAFGFIASEAEIYNKNNRP